MTIALPASALAGPEAELEKVRDQRRAVERELSAVNARAQELRDRVTAREQELADLDREERAVVAELRSTREALKRRARAAFMRGGELDTIEALLTGDGPTEAVRRASTLDVLARRDGAAIETATALADRLDQLRQLKRHGLQELRRLRAEARQAADEMVTDLEDLRKLEADLKLRATRGVVRVADGAQQGLYACLMGRPYNYIDSWGFARSGGRRHQGTDVMAPFHTPVYAFTDGTVTLRSNRLGGLSLYLEGDDGNRYYYAHLASYADGISSGSRVRAGDLVATNGNSGNASGGAPHVHFEVHPGGGGAVNPYPWIRHVCR